MPNISSPAATQCHPPIKVTAAQIKKDLHNALIWLEHGGKYCDYHAEIMEEETGDRKLVTTRNQPNKGDFHG